MRLFLPRLWMALAAIVLAGCTASGDPSAQGLVQSREWRLDTTGQETLQDAQRATDWQPMAQWKSWGFGTETLWVRANLRAAPPGVSAPWLVRVRPPFLDYVTLYDPSTGRMLRTGDALPPEGEGLTSINFALQIPALDHERSVYMQLRTTSSRVVNIDVLPVGEAQRLNRLQEWTIALATVSSAIFAIWACVQWWATREKVIGAFALKQTVATFWALLTLGFARVVIGPGLPEGVLSEMNGTAITALIGVTLWFFKIFLAAYQPSRLLLKIIGVLVGLVLTSPVLQIFGNTRWMLVLVNLAIPIAFVLILLALLTAIPRRSDPPIPLPVFLGYMVVYSALNSLPILINLGFIEAHPFTLYGNLAHMVMDGLVMFILLQVRARALRLRQQRVEMELQRSQQAMETEKRHRDEQSQLFAMLAHEIKTPLAALRMHMELDQVKPEVMERAIADMNAVIERCVHTSQLADQGLRPSAQALDPVALSLSCIALCRDPGRIAWTGPEAATPLYNDAQMLSIVLGNLLDNALKYGAAERAVEVELTRAARDGREGWQWQVRNAAGAAGLPDTGLLFTKYYRAPHARRLSGSGLGLFLVKGLAELMQGALQYQAQDGQAVFTVWLPDTLADGWPPTHTTECTP